MAGDRTRAAFPFRFRGGGETRGAGRQNCRGKEEVFVLALWMSIRVELNCQLMRFPNHVLSFKSRPPTDLFPQTAAGGKAASSVPKGQRIPRTSADRTGIISGNGTQSWPSNTLTSPNNTPGSTACKDQPPLGVTEAGPGRQRHRGSIPVGFCYHWTDCESLS